MIRDEEIKRLIHYAKALGVKVTIYNKRSPDSSAEWQLDGTAINVFAPIGTSKTEIILSLIHELGHHVWFIHEKHRRPDLKFEEAILRDQATELTPKHMRKRIYDVEKASSLWWDSIIKDTDIKIRKWKIELQKEFDIWMYEVYYEEGSFPQNKRCYQKIVYLTQKWRPK